ncbi:hypothetical protein [Streptomyces sp. NPDC096033]|uniref:hypothetical protein n=1 Tax=Streptomyces sp. NPDC096033 TaxID=3366071 RepID=UPI0038111792
MEKQTPSNYSPLVPPGCREVQKVDRLDDCRRWAAEVLREQQDANTDSHQDLLYAGITLEHALRMLLASLDAERGAL